MDSGRKDSKSPGPAPIRSRRRRQEGKGRIRVVIADDSPILLDQISSLLEPYFDVVGRAGNGRELLQAVQKLKPSVVVTDIMMPKVNGIEASRRITRNFPGMKVVALSANDDPAIIEAVFQAGASGYVSKFGRIHGSGSRHPGCSGRTAVLLKRSQVMLLSGVSCVSRRTNRQV